MHTRAGMQDDGDGRICLRLHRSYPSARERQTNSACPYVLRLCTHDSYKGYTLLLIPYPNASFGPFFGVRIRPGALTQEKLR